MKKNLLILTLLGIIVMPAIGFAACDPTLPPSSTNCPAPTTNFVSAITIILNLFFWALILVSVVFILIAAYQIVTGGGDSAAFGKAMGAIRNAIIGIIVAALAIGISKFAGSIFG